MDELPEIKKLPGVPLASLLAESLREHVRRNCKPGDKFLSERKLSEAFGVSRVTLGKAISSLVREGVLYQIHGSGTYIAEQEPKAVRKIALLVYHSDNPFYGKIVRSIQEEAYKAGFHTILVNSRGSVQLEDEALKKLKEEVDGVIAAPALDPEGRLSSELGRLVAGGFPVVVICHKPAAGGAVEPDTVIPDFRMGGYSITRHLIGRGYGRILFLAVDGIFNRDDIRGRFEGYKQALLENGVAFRDDWLVMVEGLDEFNGFADDGYKAAGRVAKLIDRGSTAVVAIGDSSAIGLLRGLREKGFAVPGDVAVCGFDDIELASQWGVELTTVRVDVSAIGREATRIIASGIASPGVRNAGKAESVVCPVEVVVRKTT